MNSRNRNKRPSRP